MELNADGQIHVPHGIQGMFVATDGTTYANVDWEEVSGQLTKITSSGAINHGWATNDKTK